MSANTTAAPTPSVAVGTPGAAIPAPVAPTNTPPIADLAPADPAADRANVVGLAVLRLGKGLLGAAVAAGLELASIEREMGAEFPTFIAAKTMLTEAEARTLIRFVREAGLSAEGLSPAVAVPLSRVLGAIALLGQLHTEQRE